MMIDTNTVVSMTEANQNFSRVTRIVDQNGSAVIFKNNAPKYLVIDFSLANQSANQAVVPANDEVLASASKMMNKFDHT